LAEQVRTFVGRLPVPLTDNERLAKAVIEQAAKRRQPRPTEMTR